MEGKVWRPGPTVCRCCLSEGCYKDISTEYFWMGKKEVYADMLSDTFNLSIQYAPTGGPNSQSRLICEPCISRLRDATDFRRQIKECEQTFMEYLNPSTTVDIEIPAELPEKEVKIVTVKVEKPLSDDDDFGDTELLDDDDDDLDDEPLMNLASKVPKKESVDVTDLIDNAKAEKRKSTTKVKATPKKAKVKEAKPSVSKAKPEKKKKGRGQFEIEAITIEKVSKKAKYQRSKSAEARLSMKKNATTILECWRFIPFRWKKNHFKCAFCENMFTCCTELREHVKICSTHHSVKDIYSKFKEMSLINVDVTNAVCRLCACPFYSVPQMRQHVIEHGLEFDGSHPDGVLPFSLDSNLWCCLVCREKFNNFLKLYEHMNTHYQHYICATCGKGYMTAPRLRKHSEVHLKGSYPCDKCGRMFTMRAARDYHKANVHAKGPRYECPHCDMRFSGYYDRMNHLNQAHRAKEVAYECSHCDKTFKTSGQRSVHVRREHFPQQRNYNCDYCEWHFKTNYELKRHMVKHSGEKKFACEVCGKCFQRIRGLKTHLKVHNELCCRLCGEMFVRKQALIAHISGHHPDSELFISDKT
ncbi:zinc finger protein draculin-like isoform X4 [Pieris brassicae]|uniref:zinc finger protein draculin-like isoform X4 n=1 Tax=Pieris brassicae TaxID=7116 RepID=UPI001E65F9D9|nr:zinc finger protein draculin-like isoform X4 [Pieris brassicae]